MSLDELRLAVLDVLGRAGDRGASKTEIVAAIGNTSPQSVQRALKQLRERDDAQIEHFGSPKRWRLAVPFSMPLEAPDQADLVAVLVAEAILEPLADPELRTRIRRLAEQLDERARARENAELLPASSSVTATLTLGTMVLPGVFGQLLMACKRKALRIRYDAPWKPAGHGRSWYEIEPWSVRVHDGAAYLRAWRRDVSEARTFRVAQIEEVVVMEQAPVARVPPTGRLWGDEHPAFGIDRDRPGVAKVRLRGPVARWVARVLWHPGQKDRWIEEGELLEREVAYRSCRELARRLLSVIDALEHVEPVELAGEIERLIAVRPKAVTRRSDLADDLPGIMYRVPSSETRRTRAESLEASAAADGTDGD